MTSRVGVSRRIDVTAGCVGVSGQLGIGSFTALNRIISSISHIIGTTRITSGRIISIFSSISHIIGTSGFIIASGLAVTPNLTATTSCIVGTTTNRTVAQLAGGKRLL